MWGVRNEKADGSSHPDRCSITEKTFNQEAGARGGPCPVGPADGRVPSGRTGSGQSPRRRDGREWETERHPERRTETGRGNPSPRGRPVPWTAHGSGGACVTQSPRDGYFSGPWGASETTVWEYPHLTVFRRRWSSRSSVRGWGPGPGEGSVHPGSKLESHGGVHCGLQNRPGGRIQDTEKWPSSGAPPESPCGRSLTGP